MQVLQSRFSLAWNGVLDQNLLLFIWGNIAFLLAETGGCHHTMIWGSYKEIGFSKEC